MLHDVLCYMIKYIKSYYMLHDVLSYMIKYNKS